MLRRIRGFLRWLFAPKYNIIFNIYESRDPEEVARIVYAKLRETLDREVWQ